MSRIHGIPWVKRAELIQKAKLEGAKGGTFADEERPNDFRVVSSGKKSIPSKTNWLLFALLVFIVAGQVAIGVVIFIG